MLSHDDEWIKSLVGWIAKRQIASYHYCEWVRGRGPGVVWTRPGSENRFLVTVIRCNSSGGAMPLQSHYRGHAGYYLVSYILSVPQFSSSLIHVSSNPEPIFYKTFYITQYAEMQKLRRSQCRARWLNVHAQSDDTSNFLHPSTASFFKGSYHLHIPLHQIKNIFKSYQKYLFVYVAPSLLSI